MHSKGHQYIISEDQPNAREVLELFVSSQSDVAPSNFERNIPVASAAAAAAVVASSIVVAASRKSSDSNFELPVAAAATAKAAVLVATTAALSKQYGDWDSHSPGALASIFDPLGNERRVGDPEEHMDATVYEPQGRGHQVTDAVGGKPDAEKISERSTREESIRTAASLDEVSDCEIPWEDITLGERIGLGTNLHLLLLVFLKSMIWHLIQCCVFTSCMFVYFPGLGSYGEVYRGDWHGTVSSFILFPSEFIILVSYLISYFYLIPKISDSNDMYHC